MLECVRNIYFPNIVYIYIYIYIYGMVSDSGKPQER